MMKLNLKLEYQRRLSLAVDYINTNLNKSISIADIAKAGMFSTFHFHRLFKAIIGESLWKFTSRLRLEKAALLLYSTRKMNLTRIAIECGYTSSATFSRAFQIHFKISPSKWRQNKSKICKELSFDSTYINSELMKEYDMNLNLEIQNMPERHVAYVPTFDGYDDENLAKAYRILYEWGEPRGFFKIESMVIGIGFDNPDITSENKCRYYVCVLVPKEITSNNTISFLDIPKGLYGVFHFFGTKTQVKDAYNYVYGIWLPSSDYFPGNSHPYEIYRSDPGIDQGGNFKMDICIPLKRFG